MSLSLQSRCVGDVTVITCSGRIVVGEESQALREQLDRHLSKNPYVLLHLGDVEFIDSGGLGLLARYVTHPQSTHGALKVCAVSPKIAEVLRITRLRSVFQPYDTEADSIADIHRDGRPPQVSAENTDILCIDESPDVLAYLREVLKNADYRPLTAANLSDALILLQAAHPRFVVISAELRRAGDTGAAEEIVRTVGSSAIVELPPGFSGRDAADAAGHVLQALRTASDRTSSAAG